MCNTWYLFIVLISVFQSHALYTNKKSVRAVLDQDTTVNVMTQLIEGYPATTQGRLEAARDLVALCQTSRSLHEMLSDTHWCMHLITCDAKRTPSIFGPELLGYYARVPGMKRALERLVQNLVDEQDNDQYVLNEPLVNNLFAFKVSIQSLKQAAFEYTKKVELITMKKVFELYENGRHLTSAYKLLQTFWKRLKAAPHLNNNSALEIRLLVNTSELQLQKINNTSYVLFAFSPSGLMYYIHWWVHPGSELIKKVIFQKHFTPKDASKEFDYRTSQMVVSEHSNMTLSCSCAQSVDHSKTYLWASVGMQADEKHDVAYECDNDTMLLPGCLWIYNNAYLHGYTQKQSESGSMYFPTVIRINPKVADGMELHVFTSDIAISSVDEIEVMCATMNGLIMIGAPGAERLIWFDPDDPDGENFLAVNSVI